MLYTHTLVVQLLAYVLSPCGTGEPSGSNVALSKDNGYGSEVSYNVGDVFCKMFINTKKFKHAVHHTINVTTNRFPKTKYISHKFFEITDLVTFPIKGNA